MNDKEIEKIRKELKEDIQEAMKTGYVMGFFSAIWFLKYMVQSNGDDKK